MSTPAPQAPIARSTSHRGNHAASESSQRPHRSQSTRAPGSSSRSQTQRTVSAGQPTLAQAAQRDHEQSNVAQAQPSSSSSQRDRSQLPVRTDSMRAGHQSSSQRSASAKGAPDRTKHVQPAGRRRTTLDTQTGRWGLGKTVGAGSMGKVKLAKNLETGEQVAIKIVPRLSTDEHRTHADRERAEHSKEIRTAREAAIVSLVNHPYICGMRDVVRTANHWYMLFEYVNGGQMLDYIISHGRLKEKQSRKFARQICSALDYCHRNSIVHRDLKIENILISKTGDIKIIDFGLSNLFSPNSHLKTFCGSLYFAAPELLQAKQYTGPEVDVWSFGIVLYVLVCGKVPFDDQSMPQLHAKIKKGYVEYPPWLSSECKNLISRMLVTDPKARAPLSEIANHPWMTKGFNGPPENYLPHREPLQLPLDDHVISKMNGFDFGSTDYIATQLTKIITSDEYQKAIKNAQKKQPAQVPEVERKRGVFDFYKRRNSVSRDTLTNSSNEAVQFGDDPINAFSPLVSVYYLVREKMDRERAQMNPGALSLPTSGENPLKMPDLPAPKAAYTNSSTYEMAGETPTGGRTRPRARTQGEDEVAAAAEEVQKMNNQAQDGTPKIVTPAETSARKEGGAAGLLRRFSTRRRAKQSPTQDPPVVAVSNPADGAATPRKSFSVRRARNAEGRENVPSSASLQASGSQRLQPELLTPPSAGESSFPRRLMSLRRSTSVDRRRLGKREPSEGAPPVVNSDPPPTSGSDGSSYQGRQHASGDTAGTEDSRQERGAASRAKSLGHARRESIQARRIKRQQEKDQQHLDVPEETEAEVAATQTEPETDYEPTVQPVILKGLFSVSTTSSKPLSFIQKDIVRVIQERGLEYEEIKGGFLCTHYPSIDRIGQHNTHDENVSPGLASPNANKSHRRKISLSALRSNAAEREREQVRQQQHAARSPRAPDEVFDESPPGEYTSEDEHGHHRNRLQKHNSVTYGKARNPGETSTHVRDDVGENMQLRFEIFIVKIPIIGLYGIQFKKVDGNMMHYKNMAQEILKSLKL